MSSSPTFPLAALASAPVASAARPKALFLLEADTCDFIYSPRARRELEELADFNAVPQTRESVAIYPEILADMEVIFSGWGVPKMDASFLAAAPNLQAVFYGAGTIRHFVSEEFWERGIVVTSAAAMNAVPVAEYTLGTILLCLRNFWNFSAEARKGRGWGDHKRRIPGGFHSKVALISCGLVARRVIELLRPHQIDCLIYDPYLSEEEAARLGVVKCSLEEAFREADVVSLHSPENSDTIGMIRGRHFESMKSGAAFINTARPAIVRQDELLELLKSRRDLQIILDVFNEEPLPTNSPLLGFPNLIATPHIAGSLGAECGRLGEFMVAEFRRYLAGEPLLGQITQERLPLLA